jgi:cellulose synthase operon protein B
VRRSIDINPRLFQVENEIRFNLIGHYTRQCENPNHSSLWLQVSDMTTLDLVIGTKPMEPDLKFLPDPFVGRKESETTPLNFVFPNDPSMDMIRAAGIVASWFGTQAGPRGVKFVANANQLPSGNAIVFLSGQRSTAGYTGVAASSLSVQRHPTDPNASVLLVNGGSDAELLRAARALATTALAMVGPTVNITKEYEQPARRPYDAPAWVRTDRPMKLGELVKSENLRVKSFYPEAIRVNYRVPPDVFTWRTEGTPLQLKYRATRLPTHQNSNLEIGVNGNFVDSIALNDNPAATPTLSVTSQINRSLSSAGLYIPPYALGGRDQLQLTFAFDIKMQGECQDLPTDNLVASIDAESTIDFSKFPKFAALPNLQYFAQIGFPYTRLADLSETSFVLPERVGAAELSLYLTLLGKMGESSGFPALRHLVTTAGAIAQHADRDLIVIGSGQNQPLFGTWAQRLPMVIENNSRRIREPHVSWRPQFRWEQADIDPLEPKAGEVTLTALGGLVTVMAFESPLRDGRSAVFFYADKEADQLRNASAIVNPERLPAYRGDFVVVRDDGLAHARVSETYFVGNIGWLTKIRWFLADNPLLVAATAAILAILAAIVLYRPLRFLVEFQRNRRPFGWLRKRKAEPPTL